MWDPRSTRRQLIERSLLGGAAAAFAAPVASADASSAPVTDPDVLAMTLAVEQLVLIAYRRVLTTRTLGEDANRLTRLLLGQELEHVAALERELLARGGRVPAAPRDLAADERALTALHLSESLGRLGSEHDCLRLLIEIEQVVEGAYYKAMSKLSDPRLLTLAAEILASEAQHQTALGELLSPGKIDRAVPDAFVQGKQ